MAAPTLSYETPAPVEPVPLARRLRWLLIACLTYFAVILGIVLSLQYVVNMKPRP